MLPTPSRHVAGSHAKSDRHVRGSSPSVLSTLIAAAIVGLCVVSAPWAPMARAADVLDLSVALPGQPEVTAASGGYTVAWDGLPVLGDTGLPELPYRDVHVVLPPGTRAADARVTPVALHRGLATVPLRTAGASVASEGGQVTVARTPVGEASYPAVRGELLGTQLRHGRAVATVRLYPLAAEIGPEGWRVADWASELDVSLRLVPDERDRVEPRRASPGVARRRAARLAEQVLNPAALTAYARTHTAKAADAAPGFVPTAAPSLDGSPVEYVIVTVDAFAADFQTLADYKTDRGIPTVVRTVDWIRDNYATSDGLSAMIRDFLRDAYTHWGTEYVMLGADVEIIPTKMIYNSLYPAGEGSELPVDLYYACLDGNWNADADDVAGEPGPVGAGGDEVDLAAELHLGRAPVKTTVDVQNLVDKILQYERDNIGDYLGRYLFMSEVLTPSNYAPGDDIVTDGATYSESIVDGLLGGKPIGYDRYYEADEFWPGSHPETKSNVLSAMTSGQYGFVNHIGHGFIDVMSVGDSSLVMRDVRGLANRPNYFILTNVNCASAAFDRNSIIERFITTAEGGGVLSIGSSRAAFPSTATLFQYSLYEAMLELGATTAGEAFTLSREPYLGAAEDNSVERWTVFSLALIGDPTLRLWTASPDSLTVLAPTDLTVGPQQVIVDVQRTGAPLEGARVCLAKTDECYAVGYTDAAGQVALDVSPSSLGEVRLSVEAPNSAIHEAVLPVLTSGSPVIALLDVTLHDDGSHGSIGNGDGRPDAGETVALLPRFVNRGDVAAASATPVALQGAYDGVTALVGASSAPALAPGEDAAGDAALLLQLDPALADRTRVSLALASTGGGAVLDDAYELEVLAPEIVPAVLDWSDVGSGNGNGLIEDGEVIRVNLSLRNDGAGAATGLTGWLDPGVFGVSVVQGSTSWSDIPCRGELEQTVELQLSIFAIQHSYEALLHVEDAYGRQWSHSFNLVVPVDVVLDEPIAPGPGRIDLVWEPAQGLGIRGYHVYRSLSPNFGYERITERPTSGATYEDSGLEDLTKYYYKVTTVSESGLESRLSSLTSLHTAPGDAPGFPSIMTAETSSHVALGDLDGDGRPEIVTAADAIYVWREDGTELRDGDGDPLTLGPFHNNGEVWTPAGVTLGDLTADPGLEIVASCRSTNQIFVFESDGGIAPGWPRDMNDWNWSTPAVGDLDDDGDQEIVATSVQGRTYAWHHDGTEVFDGDDDPGTQGVFHVRPSEWFQLASPALADLDGDDQLEVLITTRHSDGTPDALHAVRLDGTEPAGWPYVFGVWAPSNTSPAVADLNNDGILEIVVISENDYLHVIDEFGDPVAPYPLPLVATGIDAGIATPSPALGDLDEDGRLDIVAVEILDKHNGLVHVFDLDGNELPGWPREVEGNSESSPIVGDVSGDGVPDVIFGIGGGSDTGPNRIYGFRASGHDLYGFPIATVGPVRATPALADLGGDGDVDLVYAGWDLSIDVWELDKPYNPMAMPWPTFQGNVSRTGVFGMEDPDTGTDEPVIPLRLDLAQNAPNPFNPVTSIAFTLPDSYDGRVELVVYDLLGRRVRTLVDGRLVAGRHVATWRGRDDAGRAAASGVYLYRLLTDDGERRGRMTLVR